MKVIAEIDASQSLTSVRVAVKAAVARTLEERGYKWSDLSASLPASSRT